MINKININVSKLGDVSISDSHDRRWKLNQLIEKYKIILVLINNNNDLDNQKINNILVTMQEETNIFLSE